MYDYVIEMAQKHPEKFGNSVVIYANEEQQEITNENGEKEQVTALLLKEWAFSDLVDDPAATDSLFHDTNDLGAKITEFLDENPKIFDVLEKNTQIFVDFFQRYEHYSQRKHNFNVSKAIKKAKTDNYWEVRKFLPAETRAYVPAFHALKYIGNSLSLFYKNVPTLKYSFADVSEEFITKPTTFKEFAKKNKVNLQTLYFLNPHILTEQIPKNVVLYAIFPKD